jgi:DNA modification methylase
MSVLPSIDDSSVDLVVTDPPYNFDCRGRGTVHTAKDDFANNAMSPEEYVAWFKQVVDQLYRVVKDGGAVYVYCGWKLYPHVYPIIGKLFDIKNCIVWRKQHFGVGYHFRFQHEFVVFATKGKHQLRLQKRNISDVWDIDKENNNRVHPAQKPVEAMSRPILYSTDVGGLVLDPFNGSGTTSLAAERSGRKWIGIEMDTEYCDKTIERIIKNV